MYYMTANVAPCATREAMLNVACDTHRKSCMLLCLALLLITEATIVDISMQRHKRSVFVSRDATQVCELRKEHE